MKEHHLSIWFIIGLQLLIMGLIIIGAGLFSLYAPPANRVIFENLHPGLYEGAVLLLLGGFYIIKFRPK